MPRRKRTCEDCDTSITRKHGLAIYCDDCARERRLVRSRKWWKDNKYSGVIAERRRTGEIKIIKKKVE